MIRIALVLTLAAGCTAGVDEPSRDPTVAFGGKADGWGDPDGERWLVSASTIEALEGDLSSIEPAVEHADAYHSPDFYLSPSGPLGPAGPLGAWGPLGALGPIGNNTWNTSVWVGASSAGSWDEYCTSISADGPLGARGPLGPDGPLSEEAYASLASFTNERGEENDFVEQLAAGGVWSVLGPLGPLGALGPLGPLGPVGAHCAREGRGFAPDDDGQFVDADGRVVRTVDVPYDGGTRTYELVESYPESFASSFDDNDTSFMATGSITDLDREVDVYRVRSRAGQIVTVLLVPENALSDFDVELADEDGDVFARSVSDGRQRFSFGVLTNTGNYIDFIQLPLEAGSELQIRVTAWRIHRTYPTYRLVVVGSTEHFPTTTIRGAHQARD